MSLPSWECGLKSLAENAQLDSLTSLPSWECGLKFIARKFTPIVLHSHSLRGSVDWNLNSGRAFRNRSVTPFVGVWIEIKSHVWQTQECKGHSLRGSVDWNHIRKRWNLRCSRSLPSWECGLKWRVALHKTCKYSHSLRGSVDWNLDMLDIEKEDEVTPFVGVWIEITVLLQRSSPQSIVTPFVGVWIEISASRIKRTYIKSLPSWECGLKLHTRTETAVRVESLPSWECVLKSFDVTLLSDTTSRHSLRGSVDWNKYPVTAKACLSSHSLRGSVDWNMWNMEKGEKNNSHSLRGSVDWNSTINRFRYYVYSHSLRGSVDWNNFYLFIERWNAVTPFVGVWIEISYKVPYLDENGGHSLRGSVDWNLVYNGFNCDSWQ